MKLPRTFDPVPPLLIALVQLGLLSMGGADPFKDDAYICLRYARNLVSGAGLVFNPGEVYEGFTTPLWTLLSAGVLAVGAPDVATLKILGGLAFLGLVLLTWKAVAQAGVSLTLRQLAPLVVAASGAIAYWSLSGLETVAFSLAVMAGVSHFVDAARSGKRSTVRGGAWFGVAILLRPEALAWFCLLAAALWTWPWLQARLPGSSLEMAGTPGSKPASRVTGSLVALVTTVAPVLVLAGAWQVFRLVYYGEWLPNTFHAKVEWEFYVLGRGLRYVGQAALATPLGVFLLVPLSTRAAWRRPEIAFPLLVAAFHIAYLVLIGGDYMVYARFVVPVLAPLALAWAVAADYRITSCRDRVARKAQEAAPGARRSRRCWLPVTWSLIVVPALVTALVPYVGSPGVREPDPNVQRYRRAGTWLARYLEPDALVATPAIGAVGYLGRTRILDTLGIVDPYLAHHRDPRLANLRAVAGHARGDGAYVLRRGPDIILLANVWVRPVPLLPKQVAANTSTLSLTDRLLFGMPEFLERYEIVSYRMEGGDWFGMAVRRDSRYHPDSPLWTGPEPAVRSP